MENQPCYAKYLHFHSTILLCTPVNMYTCIHVHLYTCTPVHMFTSTNVHRYTCSPIHLYTCTHVYLHTWRPIHLFACTLVKLHWKKKQKQPDMAFIIIELLKRVDKLIHNILKPEMTCSMFIYNKELEEFCTWAKRD